MIQFYERLNETFVFLFFLFSAKTIPLSTQAERGNCHLMLLAFAQQAIRS